ncbi:MAG: T9SS type A sorting domain-containing protein [Candidatus Celaenobacter polaris]|nr:T9SS type A sorting domain-containing protein [Candidatus Celaenobacter polaris]
MKKIAVVFLSIMIFSVISLHADLTVNIPFDPDVVGPAYNDTNYVYVSEYFDVINEGITDSFTVLVDYPEIPTGWLMIWCHENIGMPACHMPKYPWDFTFGSGDTLKLDFSITVTSAGAINFYYSFTAPSLASPVVLDFSYTTGVSVDDPQSGEKVLLKNSPNPFSESTTISFNLKNAAPRNAEITIYDIRGKPVKTYDITPEMNSITWNSKDEKGLAMPSGVYLYTISLDNEITKTEKLLLLK